MRTTLLLILALVISSLASCSFKNNNDKIVGAWERFDDHAAGTIIEVDKKGNAYLGKITHVSGLLDDLGFIGDDIKWKDVSIKEVDYYEGKDLLKAVDKTGEVAYIRYDDVYFHFQTDDILHVTGFAKGEEFFGTTQKWKRIK